MSGHSLSDSEMCILNNAMMENPVHKSMPNQECQAYHTPDDKKREVWGWKEPNTQMYVSEILQFYPDLKYIHLLRHGLDMAFSTNKQQLRNWGWKFGISVNGDESEIELASKQLEYWIKSTEFVLEQKRQYQSRVMLVNYTELYQSPKKIIDELLGFYGIDLSSEDLHQLYTLPKDVGTNNRFLNQDIDSFNKKDLIFVESLDFKI